MVGIIEDLRAARIVPVIRHRDPEIARTACDLLVVSGLKALEVTMTVPGAADLIADLRGRYPGVAVGAGTVLDGEQARQVLNANASFVVSPCWSAEVATSVQAAGRPYLPGAMTPGEVHHHASRGATVVKVFPADAAGGPGFLKALKSVFAETPLMPTGGITPENARAYLKAGALCVGMGGNLLPAAALEDGDTTRAREQINAALAAASFHSS